MRVTFLGTGTSQGIPVIGCPCPVCRSADEKDKRLRASIWIEVSGKSFVIDSGPDFRQQMLRVPVQKLDAVLFTHSHKDHISGFDDIRAFNYLQKGPIDVFLEEAVMTAIKRDFFYMFEAFKYPGIPEADFHIINDKPFDLLGIPVIPIRVFHYKMPVLGYRIGNFAYITDANYLPDSEFSKLEGLEVLVLNALRREPHISHFTLDQATELAKAIKPKRALLTHMSHQLGLHAETNSQLPEGIELAYDGMILEL